MVIDLSLMTRVSDFFMNIAYTAAGFTPSPGGGGGGGAGCVRRLH